MTRYYVIQLTLDILAVACSAVVATHYVVGDREPLLAAMWTVIAALQTADMVNDLRRWRADR